MSSLEELIFGSPATLANPALPDEVVILTSISDEDESLQNDVTKNAVENGDTVSDHIHISPDSFTVKCVMADKNDAMAAAASLVFGADKSVTDKIKQLKKWRNEGTLLSYDGPVFSGFLKKGYDMYIYDVVISSLQISRTKEVGSGISVGIQLQKVKIAEALMSSVTLPAAIHPTAHQGQTPTATASAAPGGGFGSWLSSIFGG